MRTLRWLPALVAILITGTALIGCGGTTPQPAANPTPAQVKPVELTFWGDWGGDGQKNFETMVDGFNKSQNKIHVTYVLTQDMITKFLTAASGGGSPDIMFWDRWRTALYAPKGVLAPIDEFMAKDSISRADYYDEALKELSYGGKLYGLPLTVDARALFYNKKLLAAKGLKPPTTWDELEADAKALTEWDGNKLVRAGFSLQDVGLFNMYLQQAGGQMLTADGTKTSFNTDAGLTVLNYWDKLLNQDKVYKLGFEQGLGEGTDAFVTGKVAMLYTGPWMLSSYKKYAADLDFGVVPPPAGPKGNKATIMGGFGLVIATASQHKAEAWEFEKWWLAQPQNALLWAKTSFNIPGNKKAMQDPYFTQDPNWKPFLDSLEFAKIRPPVAGYSPAEVDGLAPELQKFTEGKQDAKTTLAKAQTQADALLTQNAVK